MGPALAVLVTSSLIGLGGSSAVAASAAPGDDAAGALAAEIASGELTATTDFDSGGGAEVIVSDIETSENAGADKRIDVTLTDPQGYGPKG